MSMETKSGSIWLSPIRRLRDAIKGFWSSDESLKTSASNDVPEEESSNARATEKAFSSAPRLNDELFVLYKPPDGLPYDTEIIFVHDLYTEGSKEAWRTTWTNDDGTCWPREFLGKKFPSSRILLVSYDACVITNSTQGRMDSLSIVAENMMGNFFLQSGNVGQTKNCPVLFVGHGLGCFVIKNLMIKACVRYMCNKEEKTKLLRNVGGFVFYSPFNSGVQWDLYADESRQRNSLTDCIRPHSAELSRLNEAFRSLRRRMQEMRKSRVLWSVLTICESHETASRTRGRSQRSGTYVSEGTSRVDCETFHFGVGDHFHVCKHQSTGDVGYQFLENRLDFILKSYRKSRINSIPKFDPTSIENYLRTIPSLELFRDLSPCRIPSYNYGSYNYGSYNYESYNSHNSHNSHNSYNFTVHHGGWDEI
ncbi:protein SERAC1 [Marchantia polymorpha subsp. ruderalis]|uniref:DUF676 domain-containing protein n=2 Tax=Marchantia polymorpha TaxID=3197 RepID=A0AAF6BDZ9_MARPO|nr:hypothetical protein MARPO_0147s0002 [Marchantia polymorpha]PTQ29104.1 hypothetical protein MARPO_0147s0002 [Marchantia polymorpha]BBN10233.1 hypothetical protein Mp_5g02030 [Marchantia polymorpha subsp. ruderalis]BBN10234.1 hypothetical protein Mp_5g02030 [Marchantia polymorpha subsp. ruderalis]|eukprot:PTQ29103.1 hypothetical protein MARPO_0147s0002 [Marchantia polymorpha]